MQLGGIYSNTTVVYCAHPKAGQNKQHTTVFDIETITCYADDKFPLVVDRLRSGLVEKMQTKLEKIILWLTKSGMVVNEAKTDLCLFSRYDCPPVILNVNGKYIISKKVINILGVSFDSKLQWCSHIAATSNKALKALNAIRIIKKFFNKKGITWTCNRKCVINPLLQFRNLAHTLLENRAKTKTHQYLSSSYKNVYVFSW